MTQKKKDKKHPMEILWIVFTVLSLFMAIRITLDQDFREAVPMYIAAALCVLFYLWRRHLRIMESKKYNEKMQ